MQKEKKKNLIKMWIGILFVAGFFVTNMKAQGATFSDDFDLYADDAAVEAAGWELDYTTLETTGCRSGKCLRAAITATGTRNYIHHALNESDVYIRFYAKRTNFGTSGGNKFLKLLGERNGDTNYANVTFGEQYEDGTNWYSYSGSGAGLANDNACNWYWYSHSITSGCTGTQDVFTSTWIMADNTWYCFEAHAKYNTDGNADGVFEWWVDGTLRARYTGVINRNDANIRNYQTMAIVEYVGGTLSNPYEMWFDDVVVSNSYVGPTGGTDTVAPANPSGLAVD